MPFGITAPCYSKSPVSSFRSGWPCAYRGRSASQKSYAPHVTAGEWEVMSVVLVLLARVMIWLAARSAQFAEPEGA